ncbi:MAG: ROK family protein [Thermotogae bacterium]|nr:ROK family protein [Thermotogota bacterium]
MRVLVSDFGGLRVKWGIFEEGELVERGITDSSSISDPQKFKLFLNRFSFDRFVLGFAGLIKEGTILHAPNHPRWEGYNLYRVFSEYDLLVDNDANLFTLGEAIYGAGKGKRFVLGVTLGTGVGGGLVIDGEIVRGAGGLGMEIGHITIGMEGPPCNCGSYGCAESYLGGVYFVERASRLFLRHGRSAPKSMKHLEEAARIGVSLARSLWEEYGRYLGILVASLINIFDPEVIVLGGGIAGAYDLFKENMFKEIRRRRVAYVLDTEIVPSALGPDAALWGGCYLVCGTEASPNKSPKGNSESQT